MKDKENFIFNVDDIRVPTKWIKDSRVRKDGKNPEDFWKSIWDFTKVKGRLGNISFQKSNIFFKNRFFPDAKLNYAQNLLKKNNSQNKDFHIVIVCKTFSMDKILPLIEAGHDHFGENKVQEAESKWKEIKKKHSKHFC